jgi:hypothetical protein
MNIDINQRYYFRIISLLTEHVKVFVILQIYNIYLQTKLDRFL